MSFGIDFSGIPEKEQKKIDKMGEALDNCVELIDNLTVKNKVKDIQIKNMDVIMESSRLKDKKVESGRSWLYVVLFGGGVALGGLLTWLGVRSSK